MTLTYVFFIAPAFLIGTVFGALVALAWSGGMNEDVRFLVEIRRLS